MTSSLCLLDKCDYHKVSHPPGTLFLLGWIQGWDTLGYYTGKLLVYEEYKVSSGSIQGDEKIDVGQASNGVNLLGRMGGL